MNHQAHPDDIKAKPLTPEDDYINYITGDLGFDENGHHDEITEDSLNEILTYQADLYREIEAYQAEAKRQIEQIDEWLNQRTRSLIEKRDRSIADLKAWALASRTEEKKSWPVTKGTVSTRAGEDKLEVTDEDALIKYLLKKNRMDLLKINPSAADIKTAIKDDGELFDGATIKRGEPTASIRYTDLKESK